jgi:hypothetical protein
VHARVLLHHRPPLNEQIGGLLGVAGRADDEGIGLEILSICHLEDSRKCVHEHKGGKIMNSSHERNEQGTSGSLRLLAARSRLFVPLQYRARGSGRAIGVMVESVFEEGVGGDLAILTESPGSRSFMRKSRGRREATASRFAKRMKMTPVDFYVKRYTPLG